MHACMHARQGGGSTIVVIVVHRQSQQGGALTAPKTVYIYVTYHNRVFGTENRRSGAEKSAIRALSKRVASVARCLVTGACRSGSMTQLERDDSALVGPARGGL